jgi:hypothetical protein
MDNQANKATSVLLGGVKYEVHTDECGNPLKIRRYNEKYKMWVTVTFSSTENPDCERELLALLKQSYLHRMTGVLSTVA